MATKKKQQSAAAVEAPAPDATSEAAPAPVTPKAVPQAKEAVLKLRMASTAPEGEGQRVVLQAIYDKRLDADRRFALATPDAELRALVDNPALRELFAGPKVAGAEYLLTIRRVGT